MKNTQMKSVTLQCIFILLVFLLPGPVRAESALYISETPMKRDSGEPDRGGGHTEHRASAARIYYLSSEEVSGNAELLVFRPDGSRGQASMHVCQDGRMLTVDTRPMDASSDGIFLVYVVDRRVEDKTLRVRVAKLNLLNHSCRWGHEYKFDSERLRAKFSSDVPLDMTASPLWDGNFHSRTMSGDTIQVQVLHGGRPLERARVTVRTQRGWTKTLTTDNNGQVSVQLIRDYYPSKWSEFKKDRKETFLITAEAEFEEEGTLDGIPYEKVRVMTSLPWKYAPAKREYASYGYGLSFASAFVVVTGLAVFIYRERRKKPYRDIEYDERN